MKIEISKKTMGRVLSLGGIAITLVGLIISENTIEIIKNLGIGLFFLIFGIYISKQPETKKK